MMPGMQTRRETSSEVSERMERDVSVLLMNTCTVGRSGSTPSSSWLRSESSTSAAADSSCAKAGGASARRGRAATPRDARAGRP